MHLLYVTFYLFWVAKICPLQEMCSSCVSSIRIGTWPLLPYRQIKITTPTKRHMTFLGLPYIFIYRCSARHLLVHHCYLPVSCCKVNGDQSHRVLVPSPSLPYLIFTNSKVINHGLTLALVLPILTKFFRRYRLTQSVFNSKIMSREVMWCK